MTIDESTERSAEPAEPTPTAPTQTKRVYLASAIGSTIEFYDFIIYGTAASLVFGSVFFSGVPAGLATVLSFATLAIGYAARPIGGVIGGHFGDKVGRKAVLVTTMIVMGGSTVLIGLIPPSAVLGPAAAVLLVLLRLIQGLAVGAEWGGAVLMAVEHAKKGNRAVQGASTGVGMVSGTLLASISFGLLGAMSEETFQSWGWRIPFLASSVLVIVGLWVRLSVHETPLFLKTQEARPARRSWRELPLVTVFREAPRQTLLGMGIYAGGFMGQAVLNTFLLSHATSVLGVPRQTVINGQMVGLALALVSVPLYAKLADRIGRRGIYVAATVATGVWGFFLYPLAATGSQVAFLVIYVVGMTIINAPLLALAGPILSEIFSTKHRYTGASVTYQISGLVGGGIGPLLASVFIASGWGTPAVSIMVAVTCAISVACTLGLGDTHKNDLATV
jgi:MFS transporter, MHS family, shikimate and dehydroshikimate transport protein